MYAIPHATDMAAGQYDVVVSDDNGDIRTSAEAELTMTGQALPIAGGVALLALAAVMAGASLAAFRRR